MLMLNGVRLDDPQRPAIIAELSGNHGQDYAQAERLVAAAAEAGAHIVKVQTFTSESICADVPLLFGYDAQHDAWCRRQGVTRLRDLMAKGGFPRAWHTPLKRFAASCGVVFLSTPFDIDSARFLVDDVGVPGLKIASGDLTFQPLLRYAAETKLPILLSTGGATEEEVSEALCQLNLYRGHPPFSACDQVVLMHCRSVYPCPDELANLRVIETFHRTMQVGAVGWSDHTLNYTIVPALAVALGCSVVEKHLRLAGDGTSIDADHSLVPVQFAQMVQTIRSVPQILGDGVKAPHARELHDVKWARRDPSDWLRPTQAAREGAWA